jgi:hypothetical protein
VKIKNKILNLRTETKGLVLESKDVFDNRSTIEYDEYQLLPVNTCS